jgi:type III secretory pathway component EscR
MSVSRMLVFLPFQIVDILHKKVILINMAIMSNSPWTPEFKLQLLIRHAHLANLLKARG